MIEIISGTLEERLIKILQKTYPITISDVKEELKVSRDVTKRIVQKLHTQRIIQLEPLPNKTYIRLLRNDFSFIGKKRQRKFIKHHSSKNNQESKDYKGIMYS